MSKRRKRPRSGAVPARPQAKGYSDAGASYSRRALKGFSASSGSPARDIDDNNLTLRQRTRMLYMGAPIATSAIRTNRTNVVGTGVVPRPRIDAAVLGMTDAQADAWADAARREFALWAADRKACDATGLNTFYEMQQLVVQSWLASGDTFALVKRSKSSRMRPYTLRLQLVEADRVSTPVGMGGGMPYGWTSGRNPDTGNRIYDGVEVDGSGGVVAYHIANAHPWEMPDDGSGVEWQRVRAYGAKTGQPQVLHVMESERPDQYRGVSVLAQAIEPLLQMRRYTNAELDAAVIQASFSAFVKTEDPTDNPFNEVGASRGSVEPEAGISDDEDEYELGPGTINFMKPGEDVVFGDPSRPNGGFEGFIRAMATQVGAALEIPRDLLLKEFNASYSASRAALMEAWKAFRMRRTWLVDDFCRPVWELFISEAVSSKRLPAPHFFTNPLVRAAYLGCEWIGPSQGQLDPVKEINAELSAIEAGITTREAASVRINGSDWDENVRRIKRENEALADAQPKPARPETPPPSRPAEGDAGERPGRPEQDEQPNQEEGQDAEPSEPAQV